MDKPETRHQVPRRMQRPRYLTPRCHCTVCCHAMNVLQHGHVLLDERRFETRLGAPPSSRLPITHQQEVRSTSVQRRSGAELQPLYSCPWLRFHFGGQGVSRNRAILSTPHRKPPATPAPAGLHMYASALRWCSFEACTVCAACGRTIGRDGTSSQQR